MKIDVNPEEKLAYSIGDKVEIRCDGRQFILREAIKVKTGNNAGKVRWENVAYYQYLSMCLERAAADKYMSKALSTRTKDIAESLGHLEDSRDWVTKTIKKIK